MKNPLDSTYAKWVKVRIAKREKENKQTADGGEGSI